MGPRSARDISFFCSVNSIRDNTFVRLKSHKERETRETLCMAGRGLWQFIYMESQRVWPEKFNWRGRTHPECGQHPSHRLGSQTGRKKKVGWVPACISLCFLSVKNNVTSCLMPLLSFMVDGTLKLWPQWTLSSLRSFCQLHGHSSEQRSEHSYLSEAATSCYLRQEREMIN